MIKQPTNDDQCSCNSGLKYKDCCLSWQKDMTDRPEYEEKIRRFMVEHEIGDHDCTGLPEVIKLVESLVQEHLDAAKSVPEHLDFIHLGCFAWNIALVKDENKQDEYIKSFVDKRYPNKKSCLIASQQLREIINKKKKQFPGDYRFIVDYRIKKIGGGMAFNFSTCIKTTKFMVDEALAILERNKTIH